MIATHDTLLFRPHACSHCADCRLCESEARQTDEERIRTVVRETVFRVLSGNGVTAERSGFDVQVGVSARHLHMSTEDLEMLFGTGHRLTPLRDLLQPGEFAAQETVTLVGPNLRALQGVRILGPIRSHTQVELAPTDGIFLGLSLPVRASGDIAGSVPITIIGPTGALTLKEGVIRPDRHIHISPEEAARYHVREGQRIRVEVPGVSGLIFHHVRIRINEGFKLVMHLDTDDANAAGLKCGDMVRAIV